MGYTIFHADELDWQPRREGDPRLAAELSSAMTRARANLFRYPPGVRASEDFLVDAITMTQRSGGGGGNTQLVPEATCQRTSG